MEKDFPQKIFNQSTFVKSGSLVSARALGVTHVGVPYGALRKYEGNVISLTEEAKMDRTRRQNFFRDVKATGRRIFIEKPDPANLLLHPGF